MVSELASAEHAVSAVDLAPRWHTAALIALLLAVAGTGTLLQSQGVAVAAAPAADSRIWASYLPLLVVNFGLTAYVCRLFRARNALPDLLGVRWLSFGRAAGDLALALAGCVLIQGLEFAWTRAFGVRQNAALRGLLPHTEAERLTWAFVAVYVGFCEEVVYRGYLQTQIAAFSGRASVGVVLQALLFGVAHAEQGFDAALRIAIYGLLLGVLARARRSLLPAIVCHVCLDLASALGR